VKRILLIVLILVALLTAALLAPRLLEDPGYVMIDLGQWRLEMSLLTLVGGVLLAWILISLLMGLIRLPGRVWQRGREARARRQLENGLLALTEGDWQLAERELGRSLEYRGTTAGYLAAARAAQGQSDRSGRDQWLQLADARFGRRHFVTGLARARLLAGEGRVDEAVPVLEELHLRKPRHTGVLRLLLQAYQDLGRWHEVRLLTPALHKAGIVDRERADELATLAATRELETSPDIEALQTSWKALKRTERRQRELVMAYARRAVELGRPELAGPPLKGLLNERLDREALRLYANVDESERAGRIADCEHWLKEQPDHGSLHLALGTLYLDDRQYEKARICLEKAVADQPDGEAYAALGRILDRSGSLEAATQCYRNALRLKQGRGAEPLPPPGG
jgi:HemY protein